MSSTELVQLPEWKIRAIYSRAAQRHSGDRFLTGFAAAVCHADKRDLALIRPAALVIMDKYQLAEERTQ